MEQKVQDTGTTTGRRPADHVVTSNTRWPPLCALSSLPLLRVAGDSTDPASLLPRVDPKVRHSAAPR
jgi:hypothetical protein